ncbi:MAG: hypothetical protein IJP86_05410 [Synergistaceae bacterium]|nr:hypothetical protein [Synergistaceae bacterium]
MRHKNLPGHVPEFTRFCALNEIFCRADLGVGVVFVAEYLLVPCAVVLHRPHVIMMHVDIQVFFRERNSFSPAQSPRDEVDIFPR